MAIVEVTITPLGTGDPSISRYVANCHRILQEKEEIKFQLTPMGTIIEGNLDIILDIIREMHEVPFNNGALRVATTIKIDDRRDVKATMEQKINSVRDKLKR